MLTTVFSFLPGITCLFWIALNPLVRKKDKEFRAFQLLLACMGAALLSEACIASENSIVMLSCHLSRQFFALNVIPAILNYMRSWSPGSIRSVSANLWFAIPISVLFAEIILIALCGADTFITSIGNSSGLYESGDDKAVQLIILCTFWAFYPILAIQSAIFLTRMILEVRKNASNQLFSCAALVVIFLLLEASNLFESHISAIMSPAVSLILSVVLFASSCYGLYPKTDKVTLHDARKNDRKTVQEPARHDTEQPQGIRETLSNVRQMQADEDRLRIRFEDLIVTEQLFLRPGIKIADIATMLESNRTYISRLVNNTYNMSFSDYINTLRIDYAEQYLLHHKDARQSDIAAACGFSNASAFNNIFKKITGVTPKIWLATRS